MNQFYRNYVHDIRTVNTALLPSKPVMKQLTNEQSEQAYVSYITVNIKSSLKQAWQKDRTQTNATLEVQFWNIQLIILITMINFNLMTRL